MAADSAGYRPDGTQPQSDTVKAEMRPFHSFAFPPELDFDNALDVLSNQGYSLYDMEYAAEDLYIRTYKKGSVAVDVVTDEAVDMSYITFSKLDKTITKIIAEMGALDLKTALLPTQDMPDPTAPYYVTMSSNKGFDDSIFHFIKERLSQSDSQMRHYAMTSLVYLVGLDWKSKIQTLLDNVLTHETVEANKIAAREVLKALDKNNWNESRP